MHIFIFEVLNYYKSLGVLDVTETSLAGNQPNDPILTHLWMYKRKDPFRQIWRNEHISVHDCFFRNMDKYKYIINFDTDELIMSKNHTTYPELLEDLEKLQDSKVLAKSGGIYTEKKYIIFKLFSELDAGPPGRFYLWMKCIKSCQ